MKDTIKKIKKYLKTPQGKIIVILVIGVLIRIIISVFLFHGDLKSTYKRAYAYLWNDVPIFTQTLDIIPHLIEMFVLILYRFFVPTEWLHGINGFPIVFTDKYEYLNLFVYKLPYLLFDIANFFIIKKLFEKDFKRGLWANILYFLNPILIFSVYAWGRYEVIPIFFILYGLLLYKKGKNILANILLGLAIISRAPFVFFIPVIALLIGKNIKQKIINIVFSTILPISIWFIIKKLFPDTAAYHIITNGSISDFIWGTFFIDSEGVEIPIFFLGYTIIGYLALVRGFKKKVNWEEIVGYVGLVICLMFAFLHMHPQYYAWGVPFFAIIFSKKEKLNIGILATIGLTLMYPLILLTWDNDVMEMVIPLSNSLAHKDLIYIVDNHIFPSWRLIYFGRAVSSGIYIILMVNLLYILDIGKTFKESFKINF